jgi:hypothetical protein
MFPPALQPAISVIPRMASFTHGLRQCLIALLGIMMSLNAAAFECEVKILKILVHSDGIVSVWHSGRDDYLQMCNLNTQVRNISPATCEMWTKVLQEIKNKNGLATFHYTGTGTCATMLTGGNAPTPQSVADVTP